MHNTLKPTPHPHLTSTVPPTPVRTIFQYTQPRSLHQLLRDTPNNTDRSLIPYFLLQYGIPNAVSSNLYSWRWTHKCSKHVELIYENKLHWLHQVGFSRHCSIRYTVTHTSSFIVIQWLNYKGDWRNIDLGSKNLYCKPWNVNQSYYFSFHLLLVVITFLFVFQLPSEWRSDCSWCNQ
jgi:hypothetical protein